MPSPVGHALAGLLAAALAAPPRTAAAARPAGAGEARAAGSVLVTAGLIGAAAGLAPDFDFVPGFLVGDPGRFHHGPSHSIGAALAAGLATAAAVRLLCTRWLLGTRVGALAALGARRAGVTAGFAWLLHVLLDAVAVDTSEPYGVMLWWPLADRYVISPWSLFHDIQRQDVPPAGFLASLASWHNLRAVLIEALLLGPLAVLGLRLRRGSRATRQRSAPDGRRSLRGPLAGRGQSG